MTPDASIILAARNEEGRVGLAIASILEQALSELEIIVVDDASTDRTLKVLHTFAAADPRVKALSSPTNLGRAGARNLGLAHAQADLISILDADDLMTPGRLQKQVDYMAAHPDVGMLGGWGYYMLPGRAVPKLVQTPTDDRTIRRRLDQGIMPLIHSSMMLRRELLASHGGYVRVTPHYNEDYDLCARLIGTTKAASLPEPVVVVSCDGLLSPRRIKGKHRELIELEAHLLHKHFAWRRWLNLTVRRLAVHLPAQTDAWLMRRRLERLPDCPTAEMRSLAAWIARVEHAAMRVDASQDRD